MDHLLPQLEAAVTAWHERSWPPPQAMVVSGSGLAVDLFPAAFPALRLAEVVPIEVHEVEGHPHRCEILLPVAGHPVLYLRGRLHGYQGYSPAEVVFPLRLAALLGARTLVMTNAAGAIDPELAAGQLVLIRDHLNLTGASPLRGSPPATWGPRFPDMVDAYDPGLRALARRHAGALGITLGEGVYAALPGPSYETPAEVRMLRTLGADLVGMSTVLEVIAARHLGMRCLCLSLASNPAAGVVAGPLDHAEVLAAGAAAATAVQRLLRALLADPALYG